MLKLASQRPDPADSPALKMRSIGRRFPEAGDLLSERFRKHIHLRLSKTQNSVRPPIHIFDEDRFVLSVAFRERKQTVDSCLHRSDPCAVLFVVLPRDSWGT